MPKFRIQHFSNCPEITFCVLGDSHAQLLAKTFDNIGKRHGIKGMIISHRATPPVLGWSHRFHFAAKEPEKLWNYAFNVIQENKIKHILIAAHWKTYLECFPADEFKDALSNTIEAYSRIGCKVYLLLGHPVYEASIPKIIIADRFFDRENRNSLGKTIEMHKKENNVMYQIVNEKKIPAFDPIDYFKSANDECLVVKNGSILYWDDNHLTQNAIDGAWNNTIDEIFEKYFHGLVKSQ